MFIVLFFLHSFTHDWLRFISYNFSFVLKRQFEPESIMLEFELKITNFLSKNRLVYIMVILIIIDILSSYSSIIVFVQKEIK